MHGEGDLLDVVLALSADRFLLGLGQRWQKHGGKDGDDHEQLNQSESQTFAFRHRQLFHRDTQI